MVRFQVRAPAELGLVAFCNVHALIAQQILFSGQHLETVALPRRRLICTVLSGNVDNTLSCHV
ncbi:hypothetical protein T03_17466 [Trichinella britovi]|uniref:Uncharacterized protein n=2 Tax=Trichinella TaxID=6333 RepID=A0A0V1CP52_TRIBR|nr:hypothetical protein T05_6451 [Trichinella murrelli]KRY51056.1 hypothetical protein T03_17466 [Trichinella britovi]